MIRANRSHPWREKVLVHWLLVGAVFGQTVSVVTTVKELGDHVTTITAQEPATRFGQGLKRLGDINGDGKQDFFFFDAQPTHADGASGYIFLGCTPLPRQVDLSRWSEWGIRLESPPGGRSLFSIQGVGDLNGDGIDDMAFGACDPGVGSPCPAFILFGSRELPHVISLGDLTGVTGCELTPDRSLEGSSWLFSSFAGGDVNGDGFRDLIIGLSRSNRPAYLKQEGLVYVVSGQRPFPASIDLSTLGVSQPGCKISANQDPAQAEGAGFGGLVASGQDFNADGFDEIVATAPYWTNFVAETPVVKAGAVLVVFGRAQWQGTLDVGQDALDGEAVCRVSTDVEGRVLANESETATGIVEDLTGDGRPDLLIGYNGLALISGADIVPGDFLIEAALTTVFVTDGVGWGGTFGAARVPDRDGDGASELATGVVRAGTSSLGGLQTGAVFLVRGRAQWDSPFLYPYMNTAGITQIFGDDEKLLFGQTVLNEDIDGDGVTDMVVAAPGSMSLPQPGSTAVGRVYIIPGTTPFLGGLAANAFAPKRSALAGGGRLSVRGNGFTEETEIFLGDVRLQVLERPDSRRIVARIPPREAAGKFPVRIRRGNDEVAAAEEFEFFDSLFPYEFDVGHLGAPGAAVKGSAITDSLFLPDDSHMLLWWEEAIGGKGDFTGDGIADVLLAYGVAPAAGTVFVLHGGQDLPVSLDTEAIASWATILVSEFEGDSFGAACALVGDMNGDGMSELAITAPSNGKVYVIYGGPIDKGVVSLTSLLAKGRAFTIDECPYTVQGGETLGAEIVRLGDVNGDGKADFGVKTEVGIPYGESYVLFALAFVAGKDTYPSLVHFGSLPRVYAELPPNGGVEAALYECRGVGDIDGDGFDDVTMQSFANEDPEVSGSQLYLGEYLYFGRAVFAAESTLDFEVERGGAVLLVEHPEQYWKWWQTNIYGVGDQNGDGRDDLVFRCKPPPHDLPGGTEERRLGIVYGGTRSSFAPPRMLGNDAEFDVVFTPSPGFSGGGDVGVPSGGVPLGGGDIDADGIPDILLSDHHSPPTTPLPSRAIVLFGGGLEEKAGPIGDVDDLFQVVCYVDRAMDPQTGWFPLRFGFIGDVNGDGYEDMIARGKGTAWLILNPLGSQVFGNPFTRGDANQDNAIDIADAIAVLQFLFAHGAVLPCMDAGDANDDETVNIADAVRVLSYLFGSGAKPPMPPPNDCGFDPPAAGEERLDCRDAICE